MKKLCAILLSLLLIVTILASCTADDPPPPEEDDAEAVIAPIEPEEEEAEEIVLTFWSHLWEPWNISDDMMIAAFEERYPHIRVERESFPYDDFMTRTMTSLAAGGDGGADVYKLWGGWAVDFAPHGVFEPADPELYAYLQETVFPAALGAFRYDGRLYGVPLEFNAEWGGMLVNRAYFEENDLEFPTTWDEMIGIATEHAVSSDGVFQMRGFDFISFDSVAYTYLHMILSQGGQYVTNGTEFDFDTPEAIHALQTLADLITVNEVTSIAPLLGGADIENFDQVFLGQALMAPRGPWVIPTGEQSYDLTLGVEFDYIATPFYGSYTRWAAETGWGLAVNAMSEHSEAAWKFVAFMTEPDNLRQINLDCAMIPANIEVARGFGAYAPHLQPILDVLDGAQHVGYINTDLLKQSIIDAFVDVVENDMPAEEAVLALNEALN